MTEKPFSLTGIASFVCGLVFPFTIFVAYQFPYRGWSMEFATVGSILTATTALGLGIATFFQKKTRRTFGVIGFCFGLVETGALAALAVLIRAFAEIFGRK